MKKDFSQPLNINETTHYELLVQDSATKEFLLFRSNNPAEDWYYNLTIDIKNGEQLSLALTKQLYEAGLVLNHYHELARQTMVNFSFVDATPGTEKSEICLLAVVNSRADASLERTKFVSIEKILPLLLQNPSYSPTVEIGVAKLLAEKSVSDPS